MASQRDKLTTMSSFDLASYVPGLSTGEESADDGVDPNPPAWSGRPRGIQPTTVPIALVMGESERATVLLTTVQAYPSGVSMIISCHLKKPTAGDDIGDPISEGRLQLAIDFPDGQRLTGTDPLTEYEHPNAQRLRPHQEEDDEWAPGHAVLRRAGGGRSESLLEQGYWLWPLPTSGRLRISCHWLEQDIPLTSHELEAQLFRDAAAQARPVRVERVLGPTFGEQGIAGFA
jgi:hypothetical protein